MKYLNPIYRCYLTFKGFDHKTKNKAKKELKSAMKNQTDSTRERIAEIKQSYNQIKDELKVLFGEMNTLYHSVA